MRAATGSFRAVTETDLCGSSIPGVQLVASFGFIRDGLEIVPGNETPYMDGVVTLTTLASRGLTDGVWVKVEVVQTPPTLPGDTVGRGGLPFVLSSGSDETLVESSDYIYLAHEIILPGVPDNYLAGQNPFTSFTVLTGPLRITAGYGSVTQHEVFSREPAIFDRSDRQCTALVSLMPYDIQTSTNGHRICCMVSYGNETYSLPITVPSDFVFGGGEAPISESQLHYGVALHFDKSRVDVQPRVNQAFVRGPSISGRAIRVVGDNHTDVIVPLDATGPTGSAAPVTVASITSRPNYLGRHAGDYGDVPRLLSGQYVHPRDTTDVYANAAQPDRPDKHDRALFRAANAPTWHERNIIRYGKALAIDKARHKLRIRFAWEPDIKEFLSCSAGSGEFVVAPRLNGYPFFGYTFGVEEVSQSWQVILSPTIRLLGGTTLELLPHIGPRNLMQGKYFGPLATPLEVVATEAAFSTQFVNPAYIAWLDEAALPENIGTPQSRQAHLAIEPSPFIYVPTNGQIQMSVKRFVHSWATTSVARRGVPQNISPQLPQPGEQGMELDSYNTWFPEIARPPVDKWPNLYDVGARLIINMQAWFGITVTRVGVDPEWSGNRVVYRKLDNAEVSIPLVDEQCSALSDEEEVIAVSSAGDPYMLSFSR
jgi:hypothetical protein